MWQDRDVRSLGVATDHNDVHGDEEEDDCEQGNDAGVSTAEHKGVDHDRPGQQHGKKGDHEHRSWNG